jgi:diacylglycerol kinase
MLPRKTQSYNLIRSFQYAFEGLKTSFNREPNLTFQLVLGMSMSLISLGFISRLFAFLHLLIMFLIMSLEMMNSAIEALCDLYTEKFDLKIKDIKDISAGAVLCAAITWLLLITYSLFLIFIEDIMGIPFAL